uniref:Ig-like domain-containing protein n=1 Tax=Varanus komodoensis TaxID=61221 RepID=A0A8D2J3Z5_VARKO
MTCTPWYLLMLHVLLGALANFVLTQPRSVSASMGEMVQISCTRSSGNIGGHGTSWYQQKPNSAPVLLIYDSSTRPSDVPARFSGSKSGNVMSLTITGVQLEDEAVYYCSLNPGGSWSLSSGEMLSALEGFVPAP